MKPTLAIIATAGIVGLIWGAAENSTPAPASEPPTTREVTDWETDTVSDEPEYDTSRTFMGYECTSDCSGHEAGYDWAYDNDVCDTEYDGGNSESFAEGVRAYSEENC